jgi:hypothetical protein
MFFKNKENLSNQVHPENLYNGVCYVVDDHYFYIKNQKTYNFVSDRARDSWRLSPIRINSYRLLPDGGVLGFREGTLIQNAKDGKIYLISDAKRRLLTAPLQDYGFDISDILEVSNREVEFHREGEEL